MNPLVLLTCSLAAAVLASRADAQSVRIQAYIDGRSNLILDDDTATWQHFQWAAPGRLDCNTGAATQPTILDGVTWWPSWPDVPDCENRDCGGCFSSTITGLPDSLPNADYTPQIVVHHARGPVTIVEWPDAANGWRAAVEFEDTYFGAADWYDVEFLFAAVGIPYCTSTVNSSGNAATISVSGSLSVTTNDLVLHAQGAPVGRPGLFFYGLEPAEIPFADGWLCVHPFAPGLIRLQPVQVVDAGGAASLAVDLSSLPPWAPIAPGTTAYFQFWFRDLPAGGSGSNLTDGVWATFLP